LTKIAEKELKSRQSHYPSRQQDLDNTQKDTLENAPSKSNISKDVSKDISKDVSKDVSAKDAMNDTNLT